MIRLVLDATAIAAYARTSINVGELVAEVLAEGAGFLTPNLSLAEAAAGTDREGLARLAVLAKSGTVHVALPDWQDLGLGARVYGTVQRALVAHLAVQYRAYVVSCDPGAYVGLPTIGV